MNDTTQGNIALQVKHEFDASVERVFDAWTKPEIINKWWGQKGTTNVNSEVDLRVGGNYRMAMTTPDGKVIAAVGTYNEVDPPRKLVFTWKWEGWPDSDPSTLITIEFNQVGDKTEVTLTHEKFSTVELKTKHTEGWISCMNKIAEVLSA